MGCGRRVISKRLDHAGMEAYHGWLVEVSFVAIKNGMHQEEGFAFFTPNIANYAPPDKAHVAELGNAIKNYFEVDKGSTAQSD